MRELPAQGLTSLHHEVITAANGSTGLDSALTRDTGDVLRGRDGHERRPPASIRAPSVIMGGAAGAPR